jgi:hypothetical protein
MIDICGGSTGLTTIDDVSGLPEVIQDACMNYDKNRHYTSAHGHAFARTASHQYDHCAAVKEIYKFSTVEYPSLWVSLV